jgi:hypothetical protein
VQDAILADPSKASVINVIDIRYWYYQANGVAYEPVGGQSLAPRQQARILKPKATSFEQVYRAVYEYRIKYPDKAVLYSAMVMTVLVGPYLWPVVHYRYCRPVPINSF